MAKKKATNFNAMRPAIYSAWKNGNRKAINKDIIDTLDIDNAFFVMWQADVRKLQLTVEDYVNKAFNAKFDKSITEDIIYSARERIFPKWKSLLCCAEDDAEAHKLHVSDFDIEALIKFAWTFMDSGVGTCVCHMSEQKFRQQVESLIGCLIAENAILTDEERDTLDTYNRAQNSIQRCIDKEAELDESEKQWETTKSQVPETEKGFLSYIDNQLRIIADGKKSNAEAKAQAEDTLRKVSAQAMQIRLKIKYAGK